MLFHQTAQALNTDMKSHELHFWFLCSLSLMFFVKNDATPRWSLETSASKAAPESWTGWNARRCSRAPARGRESQCLGTVCYAMLYYTLYAIHYTLYAIHYAIHYMLCTIFCILYTWGPKHRSSARRHGAKSVFFFIYIFLFICLVSTLFHNSLILSFYNAKSAGKCRCLQNRDTVREVWLIWLSSPDLLTFWKTWSWSLLPFLRIACKHNEPSSA